MTEDLVRLEGVSKGYAPSGPPAIGELHARIGSGKITGLVGPDGAGKTTLMRLMAGLLLPDAGRILVGGADTRLDQEAVHGMIGYMPQQFGLYEDLTVMENLRLYADLRGVPPEQREASYRSLLHFTDLESFTHRPSGRLSGGMKQKLGLACALMRTPDLLLLDEPSVGVDPVSRRELWALVRSLLDRGIGVVWSTAYLDEAERCDEVLLLNEGSLLFEGPPRELTDRVASRSYLVKHPGTSRRRVLARALERSDVLDGVIQGRSVRLVMRESAATPSSADLGAGETAILERTPPRFEDAFVDALGGGPGGRSVLAEAVAARKPSGKEQPAVEARGLTKRFGRFTAAQDITFSIPPGVIFGLLGPNGAGKSTTFRMMCGLLRPTEGKGLVAGHDLRGAASKARERLGYMAQKFSLYGNLSVRQNLSFFAGVYGLSGKRRSRAVERMVDIFDLGPYLDQSAGDLPLGFKQRLALSCALMHDPAILFLDEPTSGVDPITRREFWTHINGLVEKGITVMVTTHFMDEAEYCDRIGLVFRGRLVSVGTPDELKSRAAGPDNPDPALEDAFIQLVQGENGKGRAA